MNIPAIFETILAKVALPDNDMRDMMHACMRGELADAQIAVFLALMRMKGETADELYCASRILEDYTRHIDLGENLVDIVGTGGDGKNTFNISTVSSFVAAAAGVRVAKHGNRAVSGKSGSADMLMAAGFNLQVDDSTLAECMRQCSLALLYAPHFHETLVHVREARKALGIRTLFNLLGPLANPANASRQVVGVCSGRLRDMIAGILARLGRKRVLVVCSDDGLDEISPCAPTSVTEYRGGHLNTWLINPADFGLLHDSLEPIVVSHADESLALAMEVLQGKPGVARSAIILNSAAGIYCADDNTSFKACITRAQEAIDSGAALACFHRTRDLTHAKHS